MLNKIKCILNMCKKYLLMKESTIEIDSISGCHLTRDVLFCDKCRKRKYKRTDGIIGVNNKGWTWITTDYFF